ncbi:immunoglobulin-like domain-containing protein [Fusibacillus kribbianus]|uniref:DUF5011 domain-containing protein n=1 Tax=Fusibacillus kribbianus TaxID=3044208 RepID=A0AAP4EY82_9FIRM|nr:immunoglobulin-like domain-containing protein [Ruminococcus sp. YH-rum2234]MDI9241571.1 DUF5011 domain-containing protein [Ruminococcus sp. YH-rum2234]
MKSNRSFVFKIIVSLLAVINLIALFLLNYQIPGFLPFSQKDSEKTAVVSVSGSNSSKSGYTIRFDTDTLSYDGTTKLDLLKGVSLVSPDGKTSDIKIFARILAGDSLSRKTVEYSADTADGQITATRSLNLSGYSGPSITLPDTLPSITEEQLDSVLNTMTDIYADDGYGNDITDSVQASYTLASDGTGGNVHYKFSVTNAFNDSALVEADLSLGAAKPVLTLLKTSVTIEAGDDFNPLRYVDSAVDTDGSSLSQRIRISGTVDTETPGTYDLTYTASSPSGEVSDPKKLTVIVE